MKNVFERTEKLRAGYLQDAQDLAQRMEGGTPLADLEALERELQDKLAEVRQRKAERAPLEHQHAHATHMASVLAREIEAARQMYQPPAPDDAVRGTGMPPAHLSARTPDGDIGGPDGCADCGTRLGGGHLENCPQVILPSSDTPVAGPAATTRTDPPGAAPFPGPDPRPAPLPGTGPAHRPTPATPPVADGPDALTDLAQQQTRTDQDGDDRG